MDVRIGLWRKLSAEELMLLNCGVEEDCWESLGLKGDPTSPLWRRSALGVHWKDWCQGWNSNTLATSWEELSHWKRLWCWEGLGAGGEGDDKGWDGWMASPTRWTWVWVNSGSWGWTGKPGVLWFMGSQRVGHDWETELNWTASNVLTGVWLFVIPWTISPPVSSVHGISQARILSVGSHFLLQGIFLNQGSNLCFLCLLHCRQILPLTHWGSPSRSLTCIPKQDRSLWWSKYLVVSPFSPSLFIVSFLPLFKRKPYLPSIQHVFSNYIVLLDVQTFRPPLNWTIWNIDVQLCVFPWLTLDSFKCKAWS